MELVENKKQWIENKKKDLPEGFLKQGLGSLFIAVNDVVEKLNEGKKIIKKLEVFDDLYKENGDNVVMLDIRNFEYDAELDNIAYAKRMNEELCVVVEDLLIDDYQMYLYNMYNVDGVLFDVKYTDEKKLKDIVYLAEIMGIELIYALEDEKDLDKISDFFDRLRVVSLKNNAVAAKIPENALIVKNIDSKLDKDKANVLITLKEEKNE